MRQATRTIVALYVDRATRRWIVRDREGGLWTLSSSANPWDERQPFSPEEETDLEQVPGHYKYMLGLSA